jgi:putative transposase
MSGVVGRRIRELVREICKTNDVEILKRHVLEDHVHLFHYRHMYQYLN